MTLRIFFWSNFLGRPWTVVKVLRPFRSAGMSESALGMAAGESSSVRGSPAAAPRVGVKDGRTLNPNMDVILRLLDFASGVVFVGFGEGVCRGRDWLALCAKCLDDGGTPKTAKAGSGTRLATEREREFEAPLSSGVSRPGRLHPVGAMIEHTVGLEIFD